MIAACDHKGNTPIHCAVKGGVLKIVKVLISLSEFLLYFFQPEVGHIKAQIEKLAAESNELKSKLINMSDRRIVIRD